MGFARAAVAPPRSVALLAAPVSFMEPSCHEIHETEGGGDHSSGKRNDGVDKFRGYGAPSVRRPRV
jgi:hypothetical protein